MELLDLSFSGVHIDGGNLIDDLDTLYRVAADDFRLLVNGKQFYQEEEFPVVELAYTLDCWRTNGISARQTLRYEPMGYSEIAFELEWNDERWSLRSCQSNNVVAIEEKDMESSITDFLERLVTECSGLNIDLHTLFQRLRMFAQFNRPK